MGSGYPAFQLSVPQSVSFGGPVLTEPKITPITFANDAHRPDVATNEASVESIETYMQISGFTTSFWSAVAEYGVNLGGTTGPIRLHESAPNLIDDSSVSVDPVTGELVSSIQSWLIEKLDGTHPEFGTPDENTLYALFYPVSTTVTMGQAASCQTFGAYHANVVLPSSDRFPGGMNVAYAVIPRCTSQSAPHGDMSFLTVAASHEFGEAATDPYPFTAPAHLGVDNDHLAYTALGGGEIGDLCELNSPDAYTLPNSPFQVQRLWSNQAAAAGTDPCVPDADNQPYFNSGLVINDQISPFGFPMRGENIPVGQSMTLELDFASDRPTNGPWVTEVFDLGAFFSGTPEANFCFSATPPDGSSSSTCATSFSAIEGLNGNKAYLTITVLAQGQQLGVPGLILVPMVSFLNGRQHWSFELISN
jgi:hypothetical protein